MKKLVIILFCISFSFYAIAQEPTPRKEIGLTFYNLDNFGLTYRIGNEKSLWRFNTVILSRDQTKNTTGNLENTSNNSGFNIQIGKEYRKSIANKLELRLGADLAMSYSRNKTDNNSNTGDNTTKTTMYIPGAYFVFGFNYLINDHFLIGTEITPGFSYQTGKLESSNSSSHTDISGFSYGLNNKSSMISLVYRF